MPPNASLVAYADDLAMVVSGRDEDELTDTADCAMTAIARWMRSSGLELAVDKTEVLLVTGYRRIGPVTFSICGRRVESKPEVKYLGIWFDSRLSFVTHTNRVADKALVTTRSLTRLMLNAGGPESAVRRLLASVVTSIMLYGVPVWVEALRSRGGDRLESVQRQAALRVCSAYRTVSREAVLVVAGMMPLKILGEARAAIYAGEDRAPVMANARRLWQERWTAAETGAWTRQLIPDVDTWVNMRRGHVDFYLAQFLFGHGCFGAYLHRFQIVDHGDCGECGVPDSSEHTFFECPMWKEERDRCEAIVGPLRTTNAAETMSKGEVEWTAVRELAREVLLLKRDIYP